MAAADPPPTISTDDDLLTAAEVAQYLKTTERYVWKLGRLGVLPRVVLPGGRLVRFARRDVDAMIASARQTNSAEPEPEQSSRFSRRGRTAVQTSMRF